MLFDFIAFVDTQTTPDYPNPFDTLAPYPSLTYHTQEARSEQAQVFSLHKRAGESTSVFRNETIEVYIFGYCFTRLGRTRFKDRTRLSAQRIAAAYREWGTALTEEIKGSFAILILDKQEQVTHVITDPLNVRPVYYCQEASRLVVSTSLSALLHHRRSLSLPVELNQPALIEYYLFEYTLNDDTYVRHVQTMPTGSWLRFSGQKLRVENYWNVFERLNNFKVRYDEAKATDLLEDILKQNLDLYVSEPGRTAVALTGGYDSRTNLALLGERASDYFLYSYGIADTYDLSIPQRIAQRLQLNYRPILLDEAYERNFNENARLAVALGDGIAEANRANYLYAFRQLSEDYDYILTGLFGSELIKHPTSVGNFINQDTKDLLLSDQPEQHLDATLQRAAASGYLDADVIQTYGNEVKQRVLGNPFIVNDHPMPVKYFYYLLMVGIRKYFMKEIKVERPFVENLHPFFDIEFIEALLQTPFPWVHHWKGQRNLIRSIETHKFYVTVIQRNQPQLNDILSTHAYTPRYLLNRLTQPILALEYLYYRRKIKAKRSFRTSTAVWDYMKQYPPSAQTHGLINPEQLRQKAADSKNTIKLASLQQWLDQYVTTPQTVL